MADWQVTATTIFCEAVDDEVTLIINPSGEVTCTGRQKYENPDKEAAKTMKQKSKSAHKPLKCLGDSCTDVKNTAIKYWVKSDDIRRRKDRSKDFSRNTGSRSTIFPCPSAG